MVRTARVEPITEHHGDSQFISGWKVVDASDDNQGAEISRHDTEPEAIKAARDYEGDPEYTLYDQIGEGELDQAYMVRQIDVPGSDMATRFEVYHAHSGQSMGTFETEEEARTLADERNQENS
ncbi:hypothetical protein GCM10027040_29500 [Halomonas shantousis]